MNTIKKKILDERVRTISLQSFPNCKNEFSSTLTINKMVVKMLVKCMQNTKYFYIFRHGMNALPANEKIVKLRAEIGSKGCL